MTTKALKKQLAAAIAMVLVAGVALSSSTYAWFVSNNTVKATTASISAQSNAPFLMIDSAALSEASKTTTSYEADGNTELYPAQVIESSGAPVFQSAYAVTTDDEAELTNSRYTVGTPDDAVEGKFAITEKFYIGTIDAKAGSFKDLKVSQVEVTTGAESDLASAICVLLKCGDNWAVYQNGSTEPMTEYNDGKEIVFTATDGILAATIEKASSVVVDAYVFYDGSADLVYTDNLEKLKDCGVTVTFTATPVNTQGQAVNITDNFIE